MNEVDLDQHIKNEYERATGFNAGHFSVEHLVTELADHAEEWKKRLTSAASLGILHLLNDGIDGTLPYLDGIREAITEAINQARENEA